MSKELRPAHDVIACDLCERTILKGERIEAFVVAGERRHVCELCTFRAVRARWPRGSSVEEQLPDREASSSHRSVWSKAAQWAEEQGLWGGPRGFPERGTEAVGRVPRTQAQWQRRPAPSPPPEGTAGEGSSVRSAGRSTADGADASNRGRRPGLETDIDPAAAGADAAARARRPSRAGGGMPLREMLHARRRDPRKVRAVPASREGKLELALELFNASEHRRTITGIGRALGAPWVSAMPLGDAAAAREVAIVVAWELSWYRYQVELDDADEAVLLLDRGDEVGDLDESLRTWNAEADAEGRLGLAVESVS
jgi:hypothetical protein